MYFEQVHNNSQVMLLQCISGSRAYGLHNEHSDTDIKGVFCLPKPAFYGLKYTEQVANPSNDIVYYELKRFIELLTRNNPNILELLGTTEDCILYRHKIMNLITPSDFLSKSCKQSFAGYAESQIKKARGLNKKIFNPIEKDRKTIEAFCYVINGYATIPLSKWLSKNDFRQEDCGLISVPHAKDIYALFHQSQIANERLHGIYTGPLANDVQLSSVPEKVSPIAIMSFNKDGYSAYCKDYREYWDWVGKRNEIRYTDTLDQGRNYDAKNMMHTFRLLLMAEEIALTKKINVRRTDRDFLLKIRSGSFLYDELLAMANEQIQRIENLYEKADLPDSPDEKFATDILYRIREQLYIE